MRQPSEVISLSGRSQQSTTASSSQAAAFRRLADQHLDAAYRLARAILRDSTEAQDATHDAFVQAWRKWSTLRDLDKFDQWFDRILVNRQGRSGLQPILDSMMWGRGWDRRAQLSPTPPASDSTGS